MPRSFLVKKHLSHKKPNYGTLDSQSSGELFSYSCHSFIVGHAGERKKTEWWNFLVCWPKVLEFRPGSPESRFGPFPEYKSEYKSVLVKWEVVRVFLNWMKFKTEFWAIWDFLKSSETLLKVFSETQIKPSSGLNYLFDGESSSKNHINPEIDLISIKETDT